MSARHLHARLRSTLSIAAWLAAAASPALAGVDRWDRVREQADSLAAEGQFAEAGRVMHSARMFVRVPYAREWCRRERAVLERYYEDASRAPIAERESLAVATVELRAARAAFRRDATTEAEQRSARALAIRERHLGPHHPATADARMTLAHTAFVLARVDRVDALAHEAERGYAAALGADHPRVADAAQLLGRNLKNFTGAVALPRAMAYYDRAIRIRTAAYGAWSAEVGESFHDVGNLERLAGRRAEALASFRRALEIRRHTDGVRSHGVAATLASMAMLEAERGNWAAAESLCTSAVVSAPDDAAHAPRSRAFRFGLLGQVLRQRGRAEEAGRWLRQAIAIHESLWTVTPRDEGATIFAGFSLYFDLALALAERGAPVAAFQALELGTSRTLVEHELARRVATAPAVTLESLQQSIPADVALVSWVRTRFGIGYPGDAWACVVRSNGAPHWVRLPLSNAAYGGGHPLSHRWLQEMRTVSRWPWRLAAGPGDAALAREVGRAWFSPLEPHLEGVRHIVVFSPDLCGGGPLSTLSDSTGRPIVDRFAISYVPSATWYALAGAARAASRPGPTLVVADPAFRSLDHGGWRALAGSRDEIASARAALTDVHVLQGAQASARALRELARRGELARYRVLHFSTHTAVDGVSALGSALVLAPDGPGGAESRVTAREIAETWRLDAELVCLTGCESNAGMRSASQGYLGLQQALLRAGARSVLVSTWPVEDQATALLMREFYARLGPASAGGERAQALRQAQRAVRLHRAPDGSRPYAHPAYWAGFMLIGGSS